VKGESNEANPKQRGIPMEKLKVILKIVVELFMLMLLSWFKSSLNM
jgi:hypothetical protein